VHPILVDVVASASKQADFTDTGLAGGSADTILCVDAFHFASSITAAADERARLLRPGRDVGDHNLGAGRSGSAARTSGEI
jgi:hypothetical protein